MAQQLGSVEGSSSDRRLWEAYRKTDRQTHTHTHIGKTDGQTGGEWAGQGLAWVYKHK